ncbi:MAG TPA: nicotinate-nucleotide adenylyltransferase [Vicinamibacterales bacterium]|nr:nicotinate-nucleotide adenylyltransferase [Vicinamibacterales bacterium]
MNPVPTPRRIGLVGGTFDPIHNGHLDIARAAQRELDLTYVHVITANIPPHRPQPFASTFHRFAMTALAVAGEKTWRASDLELRIPTPSYTSQTLKLFHQRGYKPDELFFILGADAFGDIHLWRDYPQIFDAARFVVVSRPGFPVSEVSEVSDHSGTDERAILIDARTADVSSTAIRQRRAEGQSIAGMVPPSVQQHIEQHGLYSPMPPDRRSSSDRDSAAAGRLHGEN